MNLDTGAIAGFEALVRWEHPERGLVPPGQFIEIAEENGAILPIGRWVLQACRQRAGEWERTGVTAPDMFMCVNVSAREIQQPGFVEAVAMRSATRFRAGSLILEITETALLRATPPTVATLGSLRELGVQIVIDDFGTGYFPLSHLRQFPVDALKIAGEFVQDTTPIRARRPWPARSSPCRVADIVTVAEGIETEEQAERMRSLGCIYGQGYYFARPQSEDALLDRIKAEPEASPRPAVPARRRERRARTRKAPRPVAASELGLS